VSTIAHCPCPPCVQEVDERLERRVLSLDRVLHLGAVHGPDVADVVDHLVVHEQEVGRLVGAEPLAPIISRSPRSGTGSAPACRTPPERLDVVGPPLAVDLAVVRVHAPNVLGEPADPVEVLREAVVGLSFGVRFQSNPSSPSVSAPIRLSDRGDVLVAAAPHRAVPEHPEMDADGPISPTTGLLPIARS
jgi:hypothetical protein